jgi:hypothetical protein
LDFNFLGRLLREEGLGPKPSSTPSTPFASEACITAQPTAPFCL